jgi:hypothetical protein
MSLRILRVLLVLPAMAVIASVPVLSGNGSASASGKSSGAATCKQLTKGQVEPLITTPITKVKVTKAEQTGQQCVYSGASGGQAIDVLILKGETKAQFKVDTRDLDHKVAVPGVGDKAYRAEGDYQIEALGGGEYCSVSVGEEDTVPGVAALEVNGSADIPESDNQIVARALGTLCNRLFKKGSTTPSLAGL